MSEAKQAIAFKAETKQLLNILIHSLYTEREIILRELISNASDALTRIEIETLTNRDILDPEVELAIRVIPNKEESTLTITDTGIGMTADELIENLGTIAQSGARAFVEATSDGRKDLEDVIGQFGVGFYSAFMAAEWIQVTSRSYKSETAAATWFSDGSDTFTVEESNKEERGISSHALLSSRKEPTLPEGLHLAPSEIVRPGASQRVLHGFCLSPLAP